MGHNIKNIMLESHALYGMELYFFSRLLNPYAKKASMIHDANELSPVYFLYGPEDFLIEEEIQKLLNRTLTQQERGFNYHLFNGGEHSVQEIVQAAQTLPMFSKYRFVLVREADQLSEEDIVLLMDYIQRPSASTCLVLHGQAIGSWKAHRKEIERTGKLMEYPRLKGKALLSWVKERMKKKGKTIPEEAADYLIEVVGDHLYDLDHALEKIFLGVGEKRAIVLSDLDEMISDVKVSTVFDLTDAIGHQNLEKALGILGKAMESKAVLFRKEESGSKSGDPVPILLSMMAKQYWSMLVIKEMSRYHRDSGDLAKELGCSPWQVKKLLEQVRAFSEASLKDGIHKCHQTDLAVKRTGGPKELLMEKLVIDLCRPKPAQTSPQKR